MLVAVLQLKMIYLGICSIVRSMNRSSIEQAADQSIEQAIDRRTIRMDWNRSLQRFSLPKKSKSAAISAAPAHGVADGGMLVLLGPRARLLVDFLPPCCSLRHWPPSISPPASLSLAFVLPLSKCPSPLEGFPREAGGALLGGLGPHEFLVRAPLVPVLPGGATHLNEAYHPQQIVPEA